MLYILDGTDPVPCDDPRRWGDWFKDAARRRVARSVTDGVTVSTVFLGVDHNFAGNGPPLLFETMIFGDAHDEYQARYATWDEAVAGHEAAVRLRDRHQRRPD